MKTKFIIFVAFFILTISQSFAQEAMLGEIKMFAGNFAPRGWAFCDGQMLSISQNSALFSILGTTYGGDGRTTFALPDLRDRSPIHVSNRGYPSKGAISLGQRGGVVTKRLVLVNFENKESKNSEKLKVLTDNGSSSNESYIQSPYLGVNYIISLYGTFPSRN